MVQEPFPPPPSFTFFHIFPSGAISVRLTTRPFFVKKERKKKASIYYSHYEMGAGDDGAALSYPY